ncbi:peptidase C39 family protein [Levilactobacillus bambusae]|nr:peptidase C39 family protein [Levilactobacillus bambusae]
MKHWGALGLVLLVTGVLWWTQTSRSEAQTVVTLNPVQKTPKTTYYRRNLTDGELYQFVTRQNQTVYQPVHHYLRNYPDTQWTSTKRMDLVDEAGVPKTYVYLSNGRGISGWINLAYVHTRVALAVPNLRQRPKYPTGCEAVATTMMLQYAWAPVTTDQVVAEMPRTKTKNGNLGFIGDPTKKTGWWIYPPALMGVVRQNTGRARNLTGSSFTQLRHQLDRGRPVVVWISGWGGPKTRVNHAITLTGYDSRNVYFNDPWSGKSKRMLITKLHEYRRRDGFRALSY